MESLALPNGNAFPPQLCLESQQNQFKIRFTQASVIHHLFQLQFQAVRNMLWFSHLLSTSANLAIPPFYGLKDSPNLPLLELGLDLQKSNLIHNWNGWDCEGLQNLHKLQRPFTTSMAVKGITRSRTLLFLFMTETCRGCCGSWRFLSFISLLPDVVLTSQSDSDKIATSAYLGLSRHVFWGPGGVHHLFKLHLQAIWLLLCGCHPLRCWSDHLWNGIEIEHDKNDVKQLKSNSNLISILKRSKVEEHLEFQTWTHLSLPVLELGLRRFDVFEIFHLSRHQNMYCFWWKVT